MPQQYHFKLSEKTIDHYLDKRQHLVDAKCDVTLGVGERSLGAVKAALTQCSPYFQQLFEKSNSAQVASFQLEDLTEVGLKAVIDFTTRGEFSACLEDLADVAFALKHCQIHEAYPVIESFLRDGKYDLTENTFLAVFKASQVFCMESPPEQLLQYAVAHLLTSFCKDFVAQENYKNGLLDTDLAFLKAVLKEWNFRKQGLGEIAAFDLIVCWIRRNLEERRKYMNELSRSLTGVGLVQNAQDILEFCLLPYSERRQLAITAPISLVTFSVINDFCTTWECYLSAYSLESSPVKYLPMIPHVWPDSSMAVFDGKVYVCGAVSEKEQSTDNTTGRLYQYDPCLDKWIELSPLPTARSSFALLTLKEKLFAIGGLDRTDEDCHTVEIYDIKTDTWSQGPPMPVAFWEFGAAVTRDGRIYVTGVQREGREQQLFCFNDGEWSKKKSGIFVGSKQSRISYHFVAHEDSLYLLCGASYCFGDDDTNKDCSFVQRYNCNQDTWIRVDIFEEVPDYFCFNAACCHDDKIYVMSRMNDPKRPKKNELWPINRISAFEPEKKLISKIFECEDETLSEINHMLPLRFPNVVLDRKRILDHKDDETFSQFIAEHGRVKRGNDPFGFLSQFQSLTKTK